jgi:peptidoglycan/LPS O-acetylase OafA/YrhL|tara:strand:+ start:180 stop:1331 length:1152 start_codon:yes stop_codon:yes gene_type:complete
MVDNSQKIAVLDVFRFVGAIIVVFVHYELIFGQFIVWGALGTTSLSWFFMVSGFVLSYVYPSLQGWAATKKFYKFRIIRIYPAYAFAIFISSTFVWLSYLSVGEVFFIEAHRPFQITYDLPEVKDTSFFLIATIRHYVFTQSISSVETLKLLFNGPLWSLVLEAYFYLCFPLFLILLRNVNSYKRVFAVFIAGYAIQFGLIEYFLPEAEYYDLATLNVPVYTNPIIRFVEFVFGMLIYKIFVLNGIDKGKGKINLLPLLVSILVYLAVIWFGENYVPYQYSSFFVAIPAVAALVYCMLNLQWYPTGATLQFCELLGGLSYVIYCLHWPYMEMAQYFNLLPESWPYQLHLAVLVSILIGLSYLVYHFLEFPLRRKMYKLLIKKQ